VIATQGLLDYPRAALSLNTVNQLLAKGPNVKISSGLEIVLARSTMTGMQDPTAVALDISETLIKDGSSVAYDNTAKIGGTSTLILDPGAFTYLGKNSLIPAWAAPGSVPSLGQGLYWGNPRTRLRPYLTLRAPGVGSAKFYQGLYIPSTPNAPMDTASPEYTVTCYDQVSVLDVPLTQSLSYAAGTNIFYILAQLWTQFQIAYESYAFLNQDMSASAADVPFPVSWALNSGDSYLDVINQLLQMIGYNKLWCDCYGTFQMTPWVSPLEEGPQWTFDATDPTQNIVDPTGTWQPDVWQTPNSWIFVQNGLTSTPVIGTGLYTVINQSNGPASIDKQLGRVLLSYHELDAASNPDLITQGDQIVLNESMLAETFTVSTAPLPIAGYKDCVTFVSNNIEPNPLTGTNTRICYVANWSLPLNGDDMQWSMGTVA
jgi:hypothetical protein